MAAVMKSTVADSHCAVKKEAVEKGTGFFLPQTFRTVPAVQLLKSKKLSASPQRSSIEQPHTGFSGPRQRDNQQGKKGVPCAVGTGDNCEDHSRCRSSEKNDAVEKGCAMPDTAGKIGDL
jgi:hypothetical protein